MTKDITKAFDSEDPDVEKKYLDEKAATEKSTRAFLGDLHQFVDEHKSEIYRLKLRTPLLVLFGSVHWQDLYTLRKAASANHSTP